MKQAFSKFGLFLALGFIIAVFNSCNKDDNNNSSSGGNASKITATNIINGSTRIVSVKAIAYGYDWNEEAIAQAPYKDNGFALELPAVLPDKYLELAPDDFPSWATISDDNAKVYELADIFAYNESEDEIGCFLLIQATLVSEYVTFWYYADRDITIKGEDKDIYGYYENIDKYDLKLKKGWNVVYFRYTESYDKSTDREVETYSITSQKPSNINFTWYFERYHSDFRSARVAAKSVENRKDVLSKLKEKRNIN